MLISDILNTAQYVVDQQGQQTAVLLDLPSWQKLRQLLEELVEDERLGKLMLDVQHEETLEGPAAYTAYQAYLMATITFQPVTRLNWRETLSLSVFPDQERFISDFLPVALIGLAKAYVRPLNLTWLPYAIYANDLMVGFLELAFEPTKDNNFWIFHFFIDRHHQGQGYGKSALISWIEHIKSDHPTCQSLHLTVHPENQRAQHLYTNAGFRPTGEISFGEPVYRLDL